MTDLEKLEETLKIIDRSFINLPTDNVNDEAVDE